MSKEEWQKKLSSEEGIKEMLIDAALDWTNTSSAADARRVHKWADALRGMRAEQESVEGSQG